MRMGTTLSAQERRRQVYEMRKAGNTWEDIEAASGLRASTCKAYVKMAISQDGLEDFTIPTMNGNAIEAQQPALALDVLTASMEPILKERMEAVRQVCKTAGMPPKMITGLLARMQSRYAPVMEAGRRFAVSEMIPMLESKLLLVLSYMDEFNISQASTKDLAYTANILIEKHQLLNNRPTQIVDANTHKNVATLMQAVVDEARRRNIPLPELPVAERVDGTL